MDPDDEVISSTLDALRDLRRDAERLQFQVQWNRSNGIRRILQGMVLGIATGMSIVITTQSVFDVRGQPWWPYLLLPVMGYFEIAERRAKRELNAVAPPPPRSPGPSISERIAAIHPNHIALLTLVVMAVVTLLS